MAKIYTGTNSYTVETTANNAIGTQKSGFETFMENILPTKLIGDFIRNKTERQKAQLQTTEYLSDNQAGNSNKVMIFAVVGILLLVVVVIVIKKMKNKGVVT